jgi:hypothetical protein
MPMITKGVADNRDLSRNSQLVRFDGKLNRPIIPSAGPRRP